MYKTGEFSESECKFLINNYSKGIEYCSKKLNRSYKSIVYKGCYLNIAKSKPRWEPVEVQFLIDNYDKITYRELANFLGKTRSSISRKVSSLKLKKTKIPKKIKPQTKNNYWSELDKQFVIDNYKKISLEEIAKKLKRTKKAILHKVSQLGLSHNRTEWTDKSIQFLIDNYTEKGCFYCAKKLNKSRGSIYTKACSLDLHKISQEKAEKKCKKYKIQLLSKYTDTTSLSKLKCHCGRIFNAPLKPIFSGNSRSCGNCKLHRNGNLTSNIALKLHDKLIKAGYDTEEKDHNYKTVYGKHIDIAIPSLKIAIEYDSWYYHHNNLSHDLKQTKKLIKDGWKVLRIRSNKRLPRMATINKKIEKLKNGSKYEVITCKSWYKASKS